MAWISKITPEEEIVVGTVVIRIGAPRYAQIMISQVEGAPALPITKRRRGNNGEETRVPSK